MQDQNMKNLAETLADVLPKAALIDIQVNNLPPGYAIGHVAVPKGHEVKRFDVDLEKFQPNPAAPRPMRFSETPTAFCGT